VLSTIAKLLTFRKRQVVNLERQEPLLNLELAEDSFEAQMERDFAQVKPEPAQALNPAYVQGMLAAADS
jgi:hypothetical protein